MNNLKKAKVITPLPNKDMRGRYFGSNEELAVIAATHALIFIGEQLQEANKLQANRDYCEGILGDSDFTRICGEEDNG